MLDSNDTDEPLFKSFNTMNEILEEDSLDSTSRNNMIVRAIET